MGSWPCRGLFSYSQGLSYIVPDPVLMGPAGEPAHFHKGCETKCSQALRVWTLSRGFEENEGFMLHSTNTWTSRLGPEILHPFCHVPIPGCVSQCMPSLSVDLLAACPAPKLLSLSLSRPQSQVVRPTLQRFVDPKNLPCSRGAVLSWKQLCPQGTI